LIPTGAAPSLKGEREGAHMAGKKITNLQTATAPREPPVKTSEQSNELESLVAALNRHFESPLSSIRAFREIIA
jgi:hypothetical protein